MGLLDRLRLGPREVPFEVVGEVPDDWLGDLARIARLLREHPWGGPSLELLLCGELPDLLSRYMPPARFSDWKQGYRDGRIAVTGAINFIAADGRRAAAVPVVSERATFLMLAGHETVEASIQRRHDAQGHRFQERTHASLAHVLWTEYAVERTRRQLFDELGLGYSKLDNGLVSKQVEGIARGFPEAVRWGLEHGGMPGRLVQEWYELARVYSMSLGRADEGSPDDRADLTAFRRHELIRESGFAWDSLDTAVRRAYRQPRAPADGLDQLVLTEGWRALYERGLGGLWKRRYASAAVR